MDYSSSIPINGLYRFNLGVNASIIYNPVIRKLIMRIGDWRYEIIQVGKYPYGGWCIEYVACDTKQNQNTHSGILW